MAEKNRKHKPHRQGLGALDTARRLARSPKKRPYSDRELKRMARTQTGKRKVNDILEREYRALGHHSQMEVALARDRVTHLNRKHGITDKIKDEIGRRTPVGKQILTDKLLGFLSGKKSSKGNKK